MATKNDNITIPVNLAKPGQRALSAAGITTLKQLSGLSEKELSLLHGIGPNAIRQIKKALQENGLSFANQEN